MKSKYWHVYAHAPKGFSSPMNPVGHLPWPSFIRDRFTNHLMDSESKVSSMRFEPDSQEEAEFLTYIKKLELSVVRERFGKWSRSHIEQFLYYWLAPKDESYGFEGDEIYENQRPCPITPQELLSYGWGCGEGGKRQIRKLRVEHPKKVKKKDIFMIYTKPIQPPAKFFGISRRFWSLLQRANLTGFETVPILDGEREWNEQQLRYDYTDKDLIDQAEWFQLTVTAEPRRPFQVTDPRQIKVCEQCGSYSAFDLPDYALSEYPDDFFADTDLQRLAKRLLPDGSVRENSLGYGLIGSARFVRMIIEHKITGFSSGSPKEGKFSPIILESDI